MVYYLEIPLFLVIKSFSFLNKNITFLIFMILDMFICHLTHNGYINLTELILYLNNLPLCAVLTQRVCVTDYFLSCITCSKTKSLFVLLPSWIRKCCSIGTETVKGDEMDVEKESVRERHF